MREVIREVSTDAEGWFHLTFSILLYLYRTVSVQRIGEQHLLVTGVNTEGFILINDLFQLLNVVSRVNTKPFELVGKVL